MPTLNTDFASVFCDTTDLLSFSFVECVVVMDMLEEKSCASTAPSLASPNIISDALWPLPAITVLRSFSDSPKVVSKIPSSAAALIMSSELDSSRTAYPLSVMYFEQVILCC